MYSSRHSSSAGSAIAAIAFLAGCSGAGSTIGGIGNGPQRVGISQSSVTSSAILSPDGTAGGSPSRVGGNLYASLGNVASVYEYAANDKKNKPPICTITGSPALVGIGAVGVDQAGTLWVPSQNFGAIDPNAYPITSYSANCGTPGITLEDPNGDPIAVAFDSKGTIYVAEAFNVGSCTSCEVSVFLRGHTHPSRILMNPVSGTARAIGVDSKNNVYLLYKNSASTGSVIEFLKGKGSGTTLGITTTYRPGGTLTFDKSDNMLVNENNGTIGTLDVFAPPYNGTPSLFPLHGGSLQCALNKLETRLACGDYGNNSVDIFSYPSVAYQFSVTAGIPSNAGVYGVSFNPAAPN
jgi:hypothetical protein